jgi:hypothetical protein
MGNFMLAFIITGIMNLVAAVIISTAKIPSKPEEQEISSSSPVATTTPGTVTMQ